MEEALNKIDADVHIVSSETGQHVASFGPAASSERELDQIGKDFISLDKLSANLKMGPIKQTVVASADCVQLSTRHSDAQAVSVVKADRFDNAFLAEKLASQLLD